MKNKYCEQHIKRANNLTERAYQMSHYIREGLRVTYNFGRVLNNLDILPEKELKELLDSVNKMLDTIHLN